MLASAIRSIVPKRFRPIGYLEHLVASKTNGCVAKGPFQGMRYLETSVGSALIPKILGIYERELNDVVEMACSRRFSLIIDIGAAEGYYAVGLARRNPQARVVAFEMEERGQVALAEMASLNKVKVEIRGKCELEDLRRSLRDNPDPLIVCDVEGYEGILLDPVGVSALCGATMLVEMHDFIEPGISERLSQRFEATHSIQTIWQEPRSRTDFPFRSTGTAILPGRYLDWAVSEWRPVRMSWLWLEPKESTI